MRGFASNKSIYVLQGLVLTMQCQLFAPLAQLQKEMPAKIWWMLHDEYQNVNRNPRQRLFLKSFDFGADEVNPMKWSR